MVGGTNNIHRLARGLKTFSAKVNEKGGVINETTSLVGDIEE